MNILRGIGRISLISAALVIATILILTTAWIPARIKGVRLAAWPITGFGRFFIWLFDVHYTCDGTSKIRRHEGFVFPNHTSFLDIILLIYILPMRFLAKAEVRKWPFIGWIGTAVDTVFVDREDKGSRESARQAIAQVERYPPIALFPEGGIFEPGGILHPFRYGAFEIAVASGIPYMPCVLLYEPLDVVFWGDESLLSAVWRFASRPGPVQARLQTLHVVHPRPDDDPKLLALEAHGAMEAILTYGGHEDEVLESGI
jgi:1-acyl-sn-glycerol-3-phosphate acyltransferase